MEPKLPPKPKLLYLKRQAKRLVCDHRAGSPYACKSLRQLRRFAQLSDDEILQAPVRLHDAQYAVALAYGFRSWQALRQEVASGKSESESGTIIDPTSLWKTLDAFNEARFTRKSIPQSVRRALADFIVARRGTPNAYAAFGELPGTNDTKIRLFTGETVSSGAVQVAREACRTLHLLHDQRKGVQKTLSEADAGLLSDLKWSGTDHVPTSVDGPRLLPGMFCCMKCTCAVWRHLHARGDRDYADYLTLGLRALRAHRNGEHGWRAWPFHYTVMILVELRHPLAIEELKYAMPRCEYELTRRSSKSNLYSVRKKKVLTRAVRLINQHST